MNDLDRFVEIRVGSVLFTDLVGFTEYNDAVGDTAAYDVLEQQTAIVAQIVGDDTNARVVKEIGDGMMIWFDSAALGLKCSVALLEAVNSARASGSFPLAVRMGLHHGEAVVRGDDLVGQMVNIAARVSDLAGPGELLVSETVAEACDNVEAGKRLRAIGPATVKGVQDPIWLHRFEG